MVSARTTERDRDAPAARLAVRNVSIRVRVAARMGSLGSVGRNSTELIVAVTLPVFCKVKGIAYLYSDPERIR